MMTTPEVINGQESQGGLELGSFLKARRLELGKTQREMRLPSGHIAQIEQGTIPNVSPATLLKLAESYEFSLTELIGLGIVVDEEVVATARAIVVGSAIMAFPEEEVQRIVETLPIKDIF